MAVGATSRTSRPTTTKTRPGSHSLVRTIALALLALMVLIGLVVLITWLILRPKKPELSIEEASIRDYNLKSSKLNSTFDFSIRVYNPNHRVSVYYETIQVYVSYQDQDVATQVMDPFFQGHKNLTRVKPHVVGRNVVLGRSIEQALKADRTGGAVKLSVGVRGKIRFKVGKWKSHHYKLKVKCAPVVVFSDPKRFQPTKCDVDI